MPSFEFFWGPKGSGDNGRGREMKVVPKRSWRCGVLINALSELCIYGVQLTEEPVWERRAVDSRTKPLELLEEARQIEK